MLINKLILKNFKQYRDEIINFPEGLTGLVGRNGAGKSTIFDAITFALFGPLKGVNLSQLKNDNASASDPVEVELEFTENNKEYIVKRTLKGVAVTSKVALFRINDQILSPLAQNATDVAKELYKIIKLDKDSFVNSFFARQKETAGLLASKPAERVIEIRKMLGFDRLDTISKKAAEKLKTLKYEIDAAVKNLLPDQKIVQLNNIIIEKKNELESLFENHENLTQSANAKFIEISSQEQKVDGLRNLQERHNALEKEIASIKTAISKTEESILSSKIEISRLEKLKSDATKLSSVVDILQNLKAAQTEMLTKKDNATIWDNILSDKTKTETLLLETQSKMNALSESIEKIQKAPETLQLMSVIKDGIEREVELLNSNSLDLGREIAGKEAGLKELKERLEHVLDLDETGVCLECERELGTQKPVLIKKYQTGIAERQSIIADVSARKSEVMNKLTIKRDELKVCTIEIVELEKTIIRLENDRSKLTELKGQLANVKENISSAEQDLLAVGPRDFDSDIFNSLKIKIKTAEEQNDVYQKMLGEIRTLPAQQEHLSDYSATLNESQAKLSTKQKKMADLNFNADELTTSDSLLKQKHQEHSELVKEAHKVEVNLTIIKGEVINAQTSLNENEERKNSIEKRLKDFDKYKIFKEIIDNFKARITSEAIPKISQEANRLFVEITKERYNGLHIDTENFDIKVLRDDKETFIETLSGGERDLAAVCLRIAVSRHIISMNGAGNMGFLALDEVFGSQDEGRRADLMFALSKVSDWFKQVFIVAHNQDVEESFPNRMIISKKGLYSSIDCRFALSAQ